MPYLLIEDFKAGLDTRRLDVTSPPGTLLECQDAHISRGGEVEKRKAFVSTFILPTGTFGLAATSTSLFTFGSAADPTVPSGMTYQRLQHPDNLNMVAIVYTENFDGKAYVIARYSDNSKIHFYDGVMVEDWVSGVARSGMTSNSGIATHFKDLIDADTNYSATVAANVVEVTGGDNNSFTSSTITTNVSGGTDDQTFVAANTQEAVPGTDETVASGGFRIQGGSSSAGVNKLSALTVNSVSIITSPVNWVTSDNVTAAAIATEINNTTSTPNYTAESSGNFVTISAISSTGSGPNAFVVEATFAGDVVSSNGSFDITGGTNAPGTNKIASITVNGIEILSTAVNWATSNTATAEAVAAQIRAYNSSPEYIAHADGATVRISPLITNGSTPNNLTVGVTVGGNLTVSTPVNVDTQAVDMLGGIGAVGGQPQITQLTVGGTFNAGDEFSVTFGVSPNDVTFGTGGNPDEVGDSALAFKAKMYSTAGSVLYYSSVNDVTKWNTDDIGAGFTNMANQAAGSQELKGLASYFNNVAIFSKSNVQIWYVDEDPASNAQLQVLKNTGTFAGKSIESFGDNDVFYLSDSGVRSLRARDSSNSASVSDVGTAIDPLINTHVSGLTTAQKESAQSIIEPIDGRYWLVINDTIYVFSHFPGSKISAWSTYKPGFTPSDIVVQDNHVYVRSGDSVFLYGGADGNTYDTTQPVMVLPFLDASDPATSKAFTGIDVAAEGQWLIELATEPSEVTTTYDIVATITGTTYTQNKAAVSGNSTHFSARLTGAAVAEAAKIGHFVMHYDKV